MLERLRTSRDPRSYQITVLAGLLGLGTLGLGFDVSPTEIALALGSALLTQLLFTRIHRLPGFDPRSPLISALSLALLLRTDLPLLFALGGALAIASKFLVRARGRHVLNPTNGAIVGLLVLTDRAWISSGQWGNPALLAFFLACAGGVVVNRAARSDVTYAFLATFAAIHVGRALWLGDPLAVPLHRLSSGAVLLFAFFMISDPKTTPSARGPRAAYGAVVAAVAALFQLVLHEPDGLLYALVVAAPIVPVLNRFAPGPAYDWARPSAGQAPIPKERSMTDRRIPAAMAFLALAGVLATASPAGAFCGFYVAGADAELYNEASRVVLMRDGDRTVITMASDYRGEPTEFALVVPVPTVLGRDQIHVTEMSIIDHLDAYTAPRLVEYHDPDPCAFLRRELAAGTMRADAPGEDERKRRDALGVRVEATYTVGEYDIVILSAEESGGLTAWLEESGYRIPSGAERVLGSYIKQGVRFFVAKVNLGEHARLGYRMLRPIQVAFETPRFMLPIRLGTVNANGPQDLLVYALTRSGRVQTTNYRTVELPSGSEIPEFVAGDFAEFYRAMFARQVEKERGPAVFLEYAWDMAWCDPCAADPLSRDELRELGVFWLGETLGGAGGRPRVAAPNVYVTRLHVRYDAERFPDDLFFQVTGNRENFQGRYVIRRPYVGDADCDAARAYTRALRERRLREAETLASLTGWDLATIHDRMRIEPAAAGGGGRKWYQRIWGG